ncbi:MAG: haloalkane dehalogenase [Alphaproteobacteria bacterium]|nr:haloalkane dehalogenase [Alphaproteobacteria bacterium]
MARRILWNRDNPPHRTNGQQDRRDVWSWRPVIPKNGIANKEGVLLTTTISAEDGHPRRTVAVAGSEISYVETGQESPTVVFLHGNPTSSYLWRNVIPHVAPHARCLAPDLVGMGRSGRAPDGSYAFRDHARYLDGWFENVVGSDPVILVVHDWGGALGMYWARRNPAQVRGMAYMETIVTPLTWDGWPEAARGIFQAMRSPAGEELVLEKNVFVERILPASVLRDLSEQEMAVYRTPFVEPGESRRPTLTWPRQIPIDGEPPEMADLVSANQSFMAGAPFAKLFVNAEPGSILIGPQREICRGWANQTEITVAGKHFIQEDSPHEIGRAVAEFVDMIAKLA